MEYIKRILAKHSLKEEHQDEKNYQQEDILKNKISLIVGESGRGKSFFLKNIEKK